MHRTGVRTSVKIAVLLVLVLGGSVVGLKVLQPPIPNQLCMAGGGFGPLTPSMGQFFYTGNEWPAQRGRTDIDPAGVVTQRFGLPLTEVYDAEVAYHSRGAPTASDPDKQISTLTFVFSHDPAAAILQCPNIDAGAPRSAFGALVATGTPPPLLIIQHRITGTPPVAFPFASPMAPVQGDVMATLADPTRHAVLIAVGDATQFRAADMVAVLQEIAAHQACAFLCLFS